MSTSKVFGENLRKLCESQRSIAAVAKEMDVSRIQFTRFLNGESYPKPAVLKRIVEYFGVDARIFTEPLTAEQLAASYAGLVLVEEADQAFLGAHGMEYALNGRKGFGPLERLPNECVVMWRASFYEPDIYFCNLVRFDVYKGCKVVRGYQVSAKNRKLLCSSQSIEPAAEGNRWEFRGLITEVPTGFMITLFPPNPRTVAESAFFRFDDEWADNGLLPGVSMPNRLPRDGLRSFSNAVLEFIPQTLSSIIAKGRACGPYNAKDVPDEILRYLDQS